ncbi:hypothetical protein KO02_11590 [Sphingobacterium sp. ML3W]|nr:hypothetical protein KO02_11590 [Sphingobacterium sp. ML3W]
MRDFFEMYNDEVNIVIKKMFFHLLYYLWALDYLGIYPTTDCKNLIINEIVPPLINVISGNLLSCKVVTTKLNEN